MDKSKSFCVFKDYLEYMEGVSDEDLGKAMRAVWLYENGLEVPQLSGMPWMLFTTIRRDLDRSHAISQVRGENGAKGGKQKPASSSKEEANFSKDLANVSKDEANSSKPPLHKTLDIDSNKDKDKETYTPKPPQGDLFERFWAAYPKKKSKGQARRAWDKLKPGSTMVDHMLLAIERAKQSEDWQKDGGQYIPYPATWLNAEGWEDEEPAPDPPPDRPPVKMHWVVPNPDSDNWEDLVP